MKDKGYNKNLSIAYIAWSHQEIYLTNVNLNNETHYRTDIILFHERHRFLQFNDTVKTKSISAEDKLLTWESIHLYHYNKNLSLTA